MKTQEEIEAERRLNDDTAEIMAYAKEIFRYVTEAQTKASRMAMRKLPSDIDPKLTRVQVGRAILLELSLKATNEGRLEPWMVNDAVDAELRKRGRSPLNVIDGATQQLRAQQRGFTDQERQRDIEREWAIGLTDEQADEFTAYALSQLKDGDREFFAKRRKTVRDCIPLRGIAFEYANVRQMERVAFG